MDREYLRDYEAKEMNAYQILAKKTLAGDFNSEIEIYPPAERFINIKHPIANVSELFGDISNLWGQIPFCGSLVLHLPSLPPKSFERDFFKISEIPQIIDFVKSTGRIQIALEERPTLYEGLDYLDPIFKELKPPYIMGLPFALVGTLKEIENARIAYLSLGRISYFKFLEEVGAFLGDRNRAKTFIRSHLMVYTYLKLRDPILAESVENSLVDNPSQAFMLLHLSQKFIVTPKKSLCFELHNFTLEETRQSRILPPAYQPKEVSFPCEIGKILMSKLTYAPVGLDACKEIMYHYDAYDLRKVQEAVTKAIVANSPDVLKEEVEELSEILNNVWGDKTLPRRIKGLQIGIPLSMAAIGSVASGTIGAAGGLLAGLGYNVLDKLIDLGTDSLSERIAKLTVKSYQANIYEFKKKYKTST